jgi:hypothetical protein
LNAPIYILVAGLFAAGIAWLGFRISEKMAKSLPSFVFSMGLSIYLVVLAAMGSSFFGRDGMRFLWLLTKAHFSDHMGSRRGCAAVLSFIAWLAD